MTEQEQSVMKRIKRSIEYNALDHKWLARNYLLNLKVPTNSEAEQYMHDIVNSSFDYYETYRDTLDSDPSIKALTEMCSDKQNILDIDGVDPQVFHLSNTFNEIIESDRALHKCYDCGTNARAIFLKLIEAHRGMRYLMHSEQQTMKEEYLVKKDGVLIEIMKCLERLKEVDLDTVFILSLAIQTFGHVWVIEKCNGRYHHYQTCLKSHLLLDFIERKDYGRNLQQSLDIDDFFNDLSYLLTKNTKWIDGDYRLFAKLFAFLPTYEVTNPNPGFSFTSVTY